jgi:hypothetical protein
MSLRSVWTPSISRTDRAIIATLQAILGADGAAFSTFGSIATSRGPAVAADRPADPFDVSLFCLSTLL